MYYWLLIQFLELLINLNLLMQSTLFATKENLNIILYTTTGKEDISEIQNAL